MVTKKVFGSAIRRGLRFFGWDLQRLKTADSVSAKQIRKAARERGISVVEYLQLNQGYIPAKKTIEASRERGISVCEYIEERGGREGSTAAVMKELSQAAGPSFVPETALEIGPGTGRYLEATLRKFPGIRYEFYETADDWAEWLAASYPVSRRAADGRSLSGTRNESVDLIQAHGVFVFLPFMVTFSYLEEIGRVARNNAIVIFDVFTENCILEETPRKFLARNKAYPVVIPRMYLLDFMQRCQFRFLQRFHAPMGAGESEYLIFRRAA
jgi:hypothetical protein